MARIRRFGIFQTAKFAAAMYFVSTAIFFVPAGLILLATAMATGENFWSFGGLLASGACILIPIAYGFIGFVAVAIMCLIYNFVAKMVGGIEIELE